MAKDPAKAHEMIASKALKQHLVISMYFKDPYNSTVLNFDGITGEEIYKAEAVLSLLTQSVFNKVGQTSLANHNSKQKHVNDIGPHIIQAG